MFLVAGAVLYLILLPLVASYALWRGGRDERGAAVSLLLASLASAVVSLPSPAWDRPQYGLMLVDGLFFITLLPIAVRSKRFWPQWAAAAQLIGTITHLTPIIYAPATKTIYATVQPAWAFVIMAAIALGTRQEQKDRRRTNSKTAPSLSAFR